MSSAAKSGQHDGAGSVYDAWICYTLCRECLRCAQNHPEQWKRELQKFLLKYTEIPMNTCVCKPCERSMRQRLGGMFVGEFVPTG